ncbi:MAG: alpha/beta hydrolase [Polyangiaceae bacterium]|nr:alpha/beta hydrolase [Polyangiaceae bacterium]
MSTLFSTRVTTPGTNPTRWMLFLHGIFGSGSNLRSIARGFLDGVGDPSWGALLVDLRKHGRSQDLPPPHTLQSASNDVVQLIASEGIVMDGIVGHSFGGKVALDVVAAVDGDLAWAFILDSMPGARPDHRGSESTVRVLELLESSAPTYPTREAFVARVVEHGLAESLGTWLAMNLAPEAAGGFRLRLETPAIRALLEDYFEKDLWSVLEHPPGRVQFDVVIAGASNVYSDADRARARTLVGPRLAVEEIEGASHWLHVDKAKEVVQRLVARVRG